MKRTQQKYIEKDLEKKMIFLVGPRQVGKTFLAKKILEKHHNSIYLNYDVLEDRKIIKNQSWNSNIELLVFDELHKMSEWKGYLKGVFDGRQKNLKILVTGSARMDTFKHTGDSLVGRFFVHHLLPFSPQEVKEASLDLFLERGGFPEPFLAENVQEAKRWRNQYIQGLIQRDVLDFENIHNFKDLQLLLRLLQNRVGSPVSYQSLSEDLSISIVTIKKYIQIFEALYIIFRVSPFSNNIARSLKKSSKYYFFDIGMVNGDDGIIFENLVAVSLKKSVYRENDITGTEKDLFYLRLKDGKEVDFCISENDILEKAIEVKLSKSDVDKNLKYFCKKYNFSGVQVVKNLSKEYVFSENISVEKANNFLKNLF